MFTVDGNWCDGTVMKERQPPIAAGDRNVRTPTRKGGIVSVDEARIVAADPQVLVQVRFASDQEPIDPRPRRGRRVDDVRLADRRERFVIDAPRVHPSEV
jgi:hypothetical protein